MKRKSLICDVLYFAGLTVLVYGIALVNRPAAFMVAGLLLSGTAFLIGRVTQ